MDQETSSRLTASSKSLNQCFEKNEHLDEEAKVDSGLVFNKIL